MKFHFKTTGIVLKRHPFREADLMATVITQEQGKITGLAKNARKLTHKLCGKLEPFYKVKIEAVMGQNFVYIKEIDVLEDLPFSKLNLKSQNTLHFLAELTHRLTVEEQETEVIFELWQDLMGYWKGNEDQAEILLHAGTVKLLTGLGFMASWQHCEKSNEKLDLSRSVYLNPESVSLSHFSQINSTPLSPALIKWVNFMQHYPLPQVLKVMPSREQKEQVWKLLQSLIYPLLNQPMKSERFLVPS